MDTAEVELLAGNPWVTRRKISADYASIKPAGRGEIVEPALLPGVAISVSDVLG